MPSYSATGFARTRQRSRSFYREDVQKRKEHIMPYIIAWLLGVPAFVLILIWLFMR